MLMHKECNLIYLHHYPSIHPNFKEKLAWHGLGWAMVYDGGTTLQQNSLSIQSIENCKDIVYYATIPESLEEIS